MTGELDQVRAVRPSVASPSDEARSAARRRLMAAIADEPAGLYEHRRRTHRGVGAALVRPLRSSEGRENGATSTANELLGHRRRQWIPSRGLLLPVMSVLVVAAVVAVVVLTGRHNAQISSATGTQARSVTLRYRAEPTPAQPQITPGALERMVSIVRSRARQLGVSRVLIHTRGTNEIVVTLAGIHNPSRANLSLAETALGSDAVPEFFDWEADVLLPSGTSVATQLPLRNPTTVRLSQGSTGAAPGAPGAGGMSLYDAVKLASIQPHAQPGRSSSRLGDEYYLFGAPGSPACRAAAKRADSSPIAGQHCYLAGPEPDIKKLRSGQLPHGVTISEGDALAVPQGWLVLQAANPDPAVAVSATSPAARFFVLRDAPALSGNQVVAATPIQLRNGQAELQLRLTATGAQEFETLTSALAHRGQQVSTTDARLEQHVAVEANGQLLTVLPIDYTKYPDGVLARDGSAYLQGPFTARSARTLATELADQPLRLQLISRPEAAR